MYTVKVSDVGTIVFRSQQVRLPATFNKVTSKELKLMDVICRAQNIRYEIMEKESERLGAVVDKIVENDLDDVEYDIEDTNTQIEDLFEGDDSLANLLNLLEEE
jgi:hypothetical protein